jgi:hypothetical protein
MPAINPISQSNQFEFNDSVLTTKAWNSSRYDGRQLSGSKLNKFTAGDSSYGLTPVIRNLSRTFYISSDITSLSNTGLRIDRASGDEVEDTEYPIEDPTLQFIPGFSYILINKAVTINDDNSIKVTDLSTFNASPGGVDRKKGFDREFQTNIPNGSFIGIKNLDANIKDRTDNNYIVYFNAGRLQPMLRVQPTNNGPGNKHVANSLTPTTFIYSGRGGNSPEQDETLGTVTNAKRLRQYYTGSSNAFRSFRQSNIRDLFRGLEEKRKSASPDRFFISLLNTSGALAFDIDPLTTDLPVIVTTSDDEVSGSGVMLPTQNLAELSTAEFTGLEGEISLTASLSKTFNFNQKYEVHSQFHHDISHDGAPASYSGSYDISFLNENKPALLVNLTKEVEFPEGIGRTPLVIIPETLHPYIKDNIPQFMARAGFDIGDITQINTLDETNRTLP